MNVLAQVLERGRDAAEFGQRGGMGGPGRGMGPGGPMAPGGKFGPEGGRVLIEHGGAEPWLHLLIHLTRVALVAAIIVAAVVIGTRLVRRGAPGWFAGPAAPVPVSGAAPAAAPAPAADGALERVRFRYANGELSREEFQRMSADLGGSATADPPPTETAS